MGIVNGTMLSQHCHDQIMVSYRLTWYCGYVAISCQCAMKFWCFSSCPFFGVLSAIHLPLPVGIDLLVDACFVALGILCRWGGVLWTNGGGESGMGLVLHVRSAKLAIAGEHV